MNLHSARFEHEVASRFWEGLTLFLSLLKWTFLSVLTGLLVGSASAFFLKALAWMDAWANHQSAYIFMPALGGLIAGVLIYYFAPDAAGHGTEAVIRSVHEHAGKIKFLVAPIKLLATLASVGFGGSAGKEGPCAQIGAGIASTFAHYAHFHPRDRKILVVCGIGAGFSAVFGTPIAGAVFGVEVLFLGRILYEALYPSFVAGIISYQTAQALGIHYFHDSIAVNQFQPGLFGKVAVLGILFGLTAFLFIELMEGVYRLCRHMRVHPVLKPAIGGMALTLLALMTSRDYLGLGVSVIDRALNGDPVSHMAFVWKSLSTTITLGTGGSGGIVTPLFFLGAAEGQWLGGLLHVSLPLAAALGMTAIVSGGANAPIATSIMAIELFGPGIGVYAATVNVIAFIMTGHRSVYPSQVLAIQKSASLAVPKRRVLEDMGEVELTRRAQERIAHAKQLLWHWHTTRRENDENGHKK